MNNDNIFDFISTLPEVVDIIGYGSGVKNQEGYTDDIKRQIDLILTVNDIYEFHKLNFKKYPNIYSNIGIKLIKHVNNIGTNINYVSNIDYKNNTYKIGVINKNDLSKDLITWDNMYMAGRCQKPISTLKIRDKVKNEIIYNRLNALKIALLLNHNKTITEQELYETICSLSYIGDIRMTMHCENPDKIKNIVNGSKIEFREIYNEVNDNLFDIKNNIISTNTDKILTSILDIPESLLKYLHKHMDLNNINIDELNNNIINYLKITNFKSSIAQPIKSIIINGTEKSLNYLKEKRKKGKCL
ncbi:MAG: phosphatidate cytidylyltransferase [Tenericutes bacterium]|nr:phosphatidate cytidylyltransferase [Mycoplasmatota bacterium]